MLNSPADASLMLNSILCSSSSSDQNQPGEHVASAVTLNWKNVWDYFYQTVSSEQSEMCLLSTV